jgi:hypothetical protein
MMPWVKLNDNAPRHPKVAALSDRAFRVWIRALCYAAEFLTDGRLPAAFIDTVPRKIQDELLEAGLWRETLHDGVTIHDYLKHQTSKAHIEAERRRNADRRTAGTPPVVPQKNRDQKIEVQNAQAVPPKSPAGAGDSIRVRRHHKEHAQLVLKSRQGYCVHEPQCPNQVYCLDVIALELAQKGMAS